MKKQNRICCSKLEEALRFECSHKTYNHVKKFKKKKFFIINKKYLQEKFSREIDTKENIKQIHPKSVNIM